MQKMNLLVIFLEASLFRFRLTLHLFFLLMPRVTGCPRRKNNVQKCFKNPFLGLNPAPVGWSMKIILAVSVQAKSPSQEKKNHELRKK